MYQAIVVSEGLPPEYARVDELQTAIRAAGDDLKAAESAVRQHFAYCRRAEPRGWSHDSSEVSRFRVRDIMGNPGRVVLIDIGRLD